MLDRPKQAVSARGEFQAILVRWAVNLAACMSLGESR